MLFHQCRLFFRQQQYRRPRLRHITFLIPPREEMFRVSRFLRPLPLLVKSPHAPFAVDSSTISPPGTTAARNDASASAPFSPPP